MILGKRYNTDMAKVQEIIRVVKKQRGELGRFARLIAGEGSIRGQCGAVVNVADCFPEAQVWWSPEALGVKEQKYPGHSVAVVPVGKHSGVVVDFTDIDNGPIVGSVANMNSRKDVKERLEEVYGSRGWRPRR